MKTNKHFLSLECEYYNNSNEHYYCKDKGEFNTIQLESHLTTTNNNDYQNDSYDNISEDISDINAVCRHNALAYFLRRVIYNYDMRVFQFYFEFMNMLKCLYRYNEVKECKRCLLLNIFGNKQVRQCDRRVNVVKRMRFYLWKLKVSNGKYKERKKVMIMRDFVLRKESLRVVKRKVLGYMKELFVKMQINGLECEKKRRGKELYRVVMELRKLKEMKMEFMLRLACNKNNSVRKQRKLMVMMLAYMKRKEKVMGGENIWWLKWKRYANNNSNNKSIACKHKSTYHKLYKNKINAFVYIMFCIIKTKITKIFHYFIYHSKQMNVKHSMNIYLLENIYNNRLLQIMQGVVKINTILNYNPLHKCFISWKLNSTSHNVNTNNTNTNILINHSHFVTLISLILNKIITSHKMHFLTLLKQNYQTHLIIKQQQKHLYTKYMNITKFINTLQYYYVFKLIGNFFNNITNYIYIHNHKHQFHLHNLLLIYTKHNQSHNFRIYTPRYLFTKWCTITMRYRFNTITTYNNAINERETLKQKIISYIESNDAIETRIIQTNCRVTSCKQCNVLTDMNYTDNNTMTINDESLSIEEENINTVNNIPIMTIKDNDINCMQKQNTICTINTDNCCKTKINTVCNNYPKVKCIHTEEDDIDEWISDKENDDVNINTAHPSNTLQINTHEENNEGYLEYLNNLEEQIKVDMIELKDKYEYQIKQIQNEVNDLIQEVEEISNTITITDEYA